MADTLQFKKGLLANLDKATKKAGTIYVTTDERAMYVDVDDSTRIRLGDFIEVAKESDLYNYTPFSTSALYYINADGRLLKFMNMDEVSGKANFRCINSTEAVDLIVKGIDERLGVAEETIVAINNIIGENDTKGLRAKIAKNTKDISDLNTDYAAYKETVSGEFGKVREEFAAEDVLIRADISQINLVIPTLATAQSVTDLTGVVGQNKQAAEKAVSDLITERISPLETKVGKPKDGGDAATGLFAKVAALEEYDATVAQKISSYDQVIPTLATAQSVTDLSGTVSTNNTNINKKVDDLVTNRIVPAETNITNLQSDMTDVKGRLSTAEGNFANYVLTTTYEAHLEDATQKENAQNGRLDTIESVLGTDNSKGLRATVAGLSSTVSSHGQRLDAIDLLTPNIATNTQDIADINAAIGTKTDTADTTLYGYINSSFAAADAMKFMGGISSFNALKSKTDVEAGHTYVLTAKDTTSTAGTIYAVGDLFVALNDGDNQTWTHVPSGYAPGLEALTGANNQIIMTNHSGTTVGQISVAAAAGSSITASVADNALTIGMEWGSF